MFAMVQLPPGSTREQTLDVVEDSREHFLADEKDVVERRFAVLGFSFSGNGAEHRCSISSSSRTGTSAAAPSSRSRRSRARAMGQFMQIKEAIVFAFDAAGRCSELGNANGFELYARGSRRRSGTRR